MRITCIRDQFGKKLNDDTLNFLVSRLQHAFDEAGFVTSVSKINSSSINISSGGKMFTIDTTVLGYNARIQVPNAHGSMVGSVGKKGYTRTNIPTWEQRVEFNDILNELLDVRKLQAKIKSGYFVVRDLDGAKEESDWLLQVPNGDFCYVVERIKPLSEIELGGVS